MVFKFSMEVELKDSMLKAEAKEWFDNMFLAKWFNISIIDKALELLNIKKFKGSRIYTFLHSLHCVDYDKMKPETLEKCKEICYKIIENVPVIPDEELVNYN